MRSNPPSVVGVPVDSLLVTIVGGQPRTALADNVGREVFQEQLGSPKRRGRTVFVVAARPLRELLGRDVPAIFPSELPGVFTFCPGNVIDTLIEVLHGELRSIRIGANIHASAEIVENHVGKRIQSRIFLRPNRCYVVIAIKTHPEFVQQRGGESVVFAYVDQAILDRNVHEEYRHLGSGIRPAEIVIDIAPADLVLRRHIVIEAYEKIGVVLERRRHDGNLTCIDRSRRTRTVRGSAGIQDASARAGTRWRHRYVLFEYSKVGLAERWVRSDGCEARGCRGEYRGWSAAGESYRVALVVGKEEQFVLDDGSTEGATEAVAVKSRVGSESLIYVCIIHRIQIAISEVLIQRSMETISSTLDRRIELTAGGMAELGVELIGDEGEVRHRIVRNGDQGSGHGLVVIVHAFHRKVIVARTLPADRWPRA